MIMEDFVTFEIAKKLKEKGFKKKCIAYYWEKINEHTPSFVVIDDMLEDGVCILDLISEHNKTEWSHFVDAPTISQILKWLREEKEIYIVVEPFPTMSTKNKIFWSWSFKWNSNGAYIEHTFADDENYSTYEQATLTGIEYVLDNLI